MKTIYGLGLILVIGLLFNTQPALSQDDATTSATNYRAVGYFDAKKLIEVEWFEVIYANVNPSPVQGCSMYRFAAQGHGKILYQNGYYVPGINGDFDAFYATVKQVGHTGEFKKIDEPGYGLYVLDHADNFDWIILADSSSLGDFITLFSKYPPRKDIIDLALNFFEKYNQNSHHLSLQSPKCSYDDVWRQLKKLEKKTA